MFYTGKSEQYRKKAELLEVNASLQKGLEVLLDRDSLRGDGTLWQKLQELHLSLTIVGVVGHFLAQIRHNSRQVAQRGLSPRVGFVTEGWRV
jgi:hypothetical protein